MKKYVFAIIVAVLAISGCQNPTKTDPSVSPGTPASPPTMGTPTLSPSTVSTSGGTTLLTVPVTPASGASISAVTVDLSAVGGSASQVLHDDGTNGDVTSGDGIYSASLTITSGKSAGTYNLPINVTGLPSGTASTSIGLAVKLPNLVISQIYGGGASVVGPYKSDYIELFNPTAVAVDLTGWTAKYATATGSTWQSIPLTGSIPAGKHYLIAGQTGLTNPNSIPTPEVQAGGTGMTGMDFSPTAGKVQLVNAASTVIDLVGYGATASSYEGTGPAPTPSAAAAILRSGAGADTDDNKNDFTVGTPNPHNTSN